MRSLDDSSSQATRQPTNPLQTLIPTVGIDWSSKAAISARACIVGERIVIKAIDRVEALATNPLIIRAGETGCAVILRYGVIVTFDVTDQEERELLKMLQPYIREASESPLFEELQIAFRPQVKERLEGDVLWLQECSAERLQIVAEALGKSVVLDYYETEVSSLFERIKPFTTAIQGKNIRPPRRKNSSATLAAPY